MTTAHWELYRFIMPYAPGLVPSNRALDNVETIEYLSMVVL